MRHKFPRQWTDAEEAVILQPISAKEAQARLVAQGYKQRRVRTITEHRNRIDPRQADRKLAEHLRHLREFIDTPKHYKVTRQPPSKVMAEAVRRGYARQVGKVTYRITLKGLAWLKEEWHDE